jgi:hypothetical protein
LEARWVRKRPRSARDSYGSFLQRLPHHFDGAARELRQLVEKEYAVMREGNLARFYERATAD